MPPIEREVTASVSKPMAWMPGPKRMAADEAKTRNQAYVYGRAMEYDEQGRIVGASYDYDENTTETEAKNLTGLQSGDKIRFLCDRYSYKGNHTENQFLGSEMTVSDPDRITITNTDVGKGNVLIVYKFTDIYGQDYWTPPLRRLRTTWLLLRLLLTTQKMPMKKQVLLTLL